jgi:tetratricopeptide (TPR) repeat protein
MDTFIRPRYELAIGPTESKLASYEESKDYEKIAETCDQLSFFCRMTNNLEKSEYYYNKWLCTLNDIYSGDHDDIVTKLFSFGKNIFKHDHIKFAIKILNDALEMNQRIHKTSTDTKTVLDIYYRLGECYKKDNNLHEVLRIYQEMLAIKKMSEELKNNKSYAIILVTIGTLTHKLGNIQEAKIRLYESLKFLQEYIDDNDDLMIKTLNSLGRILKMCGDLSESASIYEQLFRRLDDTDSANARYIYIAGYLVLGSVEKARGNLILAYDLYTKALDKIREIDDQTYHSDIPMILSSMSHILYQQGNFDASRRYYYESLDRINQLCLKGMSETSFVTTFSNLTNIFCIDIEEIEAMCHKSLEMMYILYGKDKDHYDVAMVLSNLGHVMCLKDNFDESEKLHQNSLRMLKRLYGDSDHPDIVMALEHYLFLKKKQEDLVISERLEQQLSTIKAKIGRLTGYFISGSL